MLFFLKRFQRLSNAFEYSGLSETIKYFYFKAVSEIVQCFYL